MSVKLAILKSGEHIISDVKELVADEKLHGYLFQNAYAVSYTHLTLPTNLCV